MEVGPAVGTGVLVTGQTVVEMAMVSVMTVPGQSVTVGAQLVTVWMLVV